MGFLEDRRRNRHAASTNWELLVPVMLMGHELGLAEAAGIPENQRGDRAGVVWQAVVEQIGWESMVQSFIDVDYASKTVNRDKYFVHQAIGGDVGDLLMVDLLETSGYNRVRADLFPDSN